MSIKQEMITGVIWSAIEKYSGIIISIIISAVLARLISPSDFGVVTIATVLISFLEIFAGLGIGPAIIQRKELTDKNLDSIFTFTIFIGCILALILFSTSGLIASFYGNPILITICKILSISLFFSSLNVVQLAVIQREKKFKLIAKRTLLLQIVSGILSIAAAFNGAGIYALVISPVFASIGMFLFNYKYCPRKIDFSLDTKPLKLIYSFSLYQFLFTFMNYFSRNLDKLIIGRFFSLQDLGFYDKSYRLMMLPLQNVTHVVTPVMQPIFSSFQDDKSKLAEKYNMIVKLLGTISFPLSVFLYYSANEIIQIVYGKSWIAAIPVFKILALSLSVQMILSTSGAIYQSVNATKYLFYNGVSNTIVTVSGFIIAIYLFSSIEAVAWAWDITITINIIISYLVMYKLVLNSSLFNMIKLLTVPLIASLVVAIILYLFDVYFSFTNLIALPIKFIMVIIIYCPIIQITKHYDIYGLLKLNLKKIW